MIKAKPSSFDLKAMQPRTWLVISVKGLSGKKNYQGLNFLPNLGDIK
jgi:streptomycin 6-kinase